MLRLVERVMAYLSSMPVVRFKSDLEIGLIYSRLLPGKLLPRVARDTLTSSMINSGLTIINDRTSRVYVFRSEEMPKVMVHELIHASGWDLPLRIDSKSYDAMYLREAYRVLNSADNGIGIYEAFVDLHAILAYSWYFGVDFDAQRAHMINVAKKVFAHHAQGSEFKESTHAFAYYVIKAALVHDTTTWRTSYKLMSEYSRSGNAQILVDHVVRSLAVFWKKLQASGASRGDLAIPMAIDHRASSTSSRFFVTRK